MRVSSSQQFGKRIECVKEITILLVTNTMGTGGFYITNITTSFVQIWKNSVSLSITRVQQGLY